MEKNQSENQNLPEDEGKAGGDNANAPVIDHKEEVDNADQAGVKLLEKEAENKQDQEETKEKKVEETEAVPEPPISLEKVSEDIDQFLLSLPLPLPQGEDGNVADHVECGRFVDIFLDLAEVMITDYEAGNTKLWQAPEKDSCFLEATHRMSSLNETLRTLKLAENQISLINRTGRSQQRVMAYLEEEFRLLLEESKSNDADHCPIDTKGKHEQDRNSLPENESTEDEIDFQGYSDDVVSCMNKIAKEMIYAGFESECCQVYTISRRNALEEMFHKLEFEKHSIDDVHKMHWDALEREIITWIKTFKQCATVCFSGEHKLAESVFSDNPAISSSLFSNLTRGGVIQLLNFAEGIAMTKRSAEKLFKILDMYETLRDMVPKMDGLFADECANELKTEIMTTRSRLGEGAIYIFCDLENSIKADSGKTPVPGGAVHPLTRYFMNYLKYACEYKDTLEQVFREHSKIEREDSTTRLRLDQQQTSGNNDNQNRAQSPFSVQLMRMMELLDSNLEVKSKLYRDVALSSIFMMNNGRYILQKIKGSAEINSLMGETWYRKRSSDLRQYHKNYQRETWVRLLGCLSLEGLNVNGKVVKPVLKERFKSFNAMFEEIHKTQSSWIVSDEQLQSELRVSISAVVIPAYRSFLGRFSQYLDPGRQTEKYIKFQPDDIETYIEELFDGSAAPSSTRRKP